MKFAVLNMMAISFFTFSAGANENTTFPIPKLKGLFVYQGTFEVPDIRRLEIVPSQTPDGQTRLKALRKDGHTCILKNPQTYQCWTHWQPEVPPAGLAESLQKFLNGREIEFTVTDAEPELIHNGSTSQDWYVREPVRVQNKMVSLYRVTRTYEGKIFITFPVSEDQPIGNLQYRNKKQLGFRLVANQKESDSVTWTYTLLPFFEAVL